MEQYSYRGPFKHDFDVDRSQLEGQSVVFTGGANGIGETCVREFVASGAFVTFGDLDLKRGQEIQDELNKDKQRCIFVQSRTILSTLSAQMLGSVVVQETVYGLWMPRTLYFAHLLPHTADPNAEPVKPKLNIVNVNMIGTLYTFKLAVHYFRKQPMNEERNRVFIITGSLTTFIDSPANWEYTATKYGLRGLMRTVRRNSHEQGIRIAHVAPAFTKNRGVEFAEQVDVFNCMARISLDKRINGRTFMIVPRAHVKEGFADVDREDYKEGVQEDDYMNRLQQLQLKIIEDKWGDGQKVRDTGLLKR
ncbi:hypothetical protein EMMF5_006515 [Cystobasidiomycetes sp. EMM_F5]